MLGMARSITRELGSRGITCNLVAPGFISTDMTEELPEKVVEGTSSASPPSGWGPSTMLLLLSDFSSPIPPVTFLALWFLSTAGSAWVTDTITSTHIDLEGHHHGTS